MRNHVFHLAWLIVNQQLRTMQGTWGWKGVLLSLLVVDRNRSRLIDLDMNRKSLSEMKGWRLTQGATVHAFAALDLALKMTPLTLDHRFYMGQETYARVRLVFMRETRSNYGTTSLRRSGAFPLRGRARVGGRVTSSSALLSNRLISLAASSTCSPQGR